MRIRRERGTEGGGVAGRGAVGRSVDLNAVDQMAGRDINGSRVGFPFLSVEDQIYILAVFTVLKDEPVFVLGNNDDDSKAYREKEDRRYRLLRLTDDRRHR